MIVDAAGLAQARQWVDTARNIFVLTGAGVSAESGVPTFRDALTGLWARFDPEELATEEAFRRQPALVWQWYEHRRALVSAAEPRALRAGGAGRPEIDDARHAEYRRPPPAGWQRTRGGIARQPVRQ